MLDGQKESRLTEELLNKAGELEKMLVDISDSLVVDKAEPGGDLETAAPR